MPSIRDPSARRSPFAAQLKQTRRNSGLTQGALAERAGLSQRTVQHLEAGHSLPYGSTVQRLADAFSLTGQERAIFEATARPAARAGPGASEDEQLYFSEVPALLTRLVGREHELEQGCDLLSRTRLLTLTGAGGIGKTRLALELATRVASLYRDGVRVVRLASLADPDLVPQRIAVAAGARERPGRQQLEHLSRALRDQQLLLVLDNCEHLLDACAGLAGALLGACPQLRILATSRERLGLTGETTWTVPPLAFPNPDPPPHAEDLVRYPAVRLFLDRVVDAQPGFTLVADTDVIAIASVCFRLEGIPLALELAAARARVLALSEIADRLDIRLRLLSDSRRAGPPRYRTLRASIDWSYDLLDEPEQTLFRQLSVFGGGWTLQAAEAVANTATDDVLETLGQLIEKSLVSVVSAAGVTRYTFLETIREYAAERLAENHEEEAVRQRHADYFLEFCEQVAPAIRGRDQLRCLQALDAEQDNLRAAAHWFSRGGQDPRKQLRLAAQLWEFWHVRGLFREGMGWLERALANDAGVCRARAEALDGLGVMTCVSGDLERGRALFDESTRLFRELGDAVGQSHAMCNKDIAQAVGGATASALSSAKEGQSVAQLSADTWAEGYATYVVSWIASMDGEIELALRASAESVALFGQVGDLRGQSFARHVQGRALLDLGRPDDAVRPLHQALEQFARIMDTWGIACILSHLVLAEANRGNMRQAAYLFGVGERVREHMGAEPLPPDLVNRNQGVALARAALGDPAFEAAVAAGRAVHFSAAIARVLAH